MPTSMKSIGIRSSVNQQVSIKHNNIFKMNLQIKIHKKGTSRWLKNKLRKKVQWERKKKHWTRDCTSGCGGQEVWCNCCEMFTQTCCVDYGTCMCS